MLVVEDSEERLKKITSFLIGYTYDIAPKANIAIDLLKTNTYDYGIYNRSKTRSNIPK